MGKSIRKVDNILDKKLIKEGISEIQVSRMFGLLLINLKLDILKKYFTWLQVVVKQICIQKVLEKKNEQKLH